MSGWYSPLVMNRVLQFFDRVMPTESTLSDSSYTYTIWNVFKLIALAGLVTFGASLSIWLVSRARAFATANRGAQELRPVASGSARAWFWLTQLAGIVLSIFVIWFLNSQGLASYRDALFTSANPTYHGLIALLCGAVTIVLSTIFYICFGKKIGFDLNASGFVLSFKSFLKTIAAVLITVAAMLLIVFTVDYLVDVNFLFIYWGFMKFGTNRIPGMILVAPMYIMFYVAMSISVNAFNYTRVLGKWKILSNILISLIASIPTLFILCYVYGIFKATGSNPMFGGLASAGTAVYAFPGFVFVAILVCRIIYQKTGNLYLGGILCGIMAAIAEWNVCEIRVHTPGTTYAGTGLVYALIAIGSVIVIGCLVYLAKQRKKA